MLLSSWSVEGFLRWMRQIAHLAAYYVTEALISCLLIAIFMGVLFLIPSVLKKLETKVGTKNYDIGMRWLGYVALASFMVLPLAAFVVIFINEASIEYARSGITGLAWSLWKLVAAPAYMIMVVTAIFGPLALIGWLWGNRPWKPDDGRRRRRR